MKTKSWVFILVGVIALGLALMLGASGGAALTYFFLHSDSVQAVLAAPQNSDRDRGVLVSYVEPGSPAEAAGLVRGDILQQVDGQAVNTLLELHEVLADLQPGVTIELTVLHGDDLRTLQATLVEQDDATLLGIGACGGAMRFGIYGPDDLPGRVLSSGVQVIEVIADSPAEKAGLKAGDLILSVDDEEPGLVSELADLIRSHNPGDSLTLSVLSEGEETPHEVTVTLGENPDLAGQAYLGVAYRPGFRGRMPVIPGENGMPFFFAPNLRTPDGDQTDPRFFFHNMPGALEMLELPAGVNRAVVIGEVLAGSPAEAAGLKVGDLVLALNGESIDSPEALSKAVRAREAGDEVILTIYRNGEQFDLTVTLDQNPDSGDTYLGVLAGMLIIDSFEDFEDAPQLPSDELPGLPGGDA